MKQYVREEQFTILYICREEHTRIQQQTETTLRYNKSTMKTYIIIIAILVLFLAVTIETIATDATPPAQPSSTVENQVYGWGGNQQEECFCYCYNDCGEDAPSYPCEIRHGQGQWNSEYNYVCNCHYEKCSGNSLWH